MRYALYGITLLVFASVCLPAQVDTMSDSRLRLTLPSPLPPLTHWFQQVPPSLAGFRGIVVTEAPTITYHPVLPYIFFDSASSDIPDRYVLFDRPVESSRVREPICTDDLECHYQVLNILGARLRRYPDLAIAIVGYNAEVEGGEDSSHSAMRAESVRRYLHEVWEVEMERMLIIAEPGSPITLRMSAPFPTWRVDARRVEIEMLFDIVEGSSWNERKSRQDSLNYLLFGPTSDTTMEWLAFPAAIPVAPHRVDVSSATNVHVDVRLEGEVIDRFSDMVPGKGPVSYFLMRAMPNLIRGGEDGLGFTLVVHDSGSRVRQSAELRFPTLVVSASEARQRFATERRVIRGRVISGLWREDPSPFGSVARGTIRLFRREKVGEAYQLFLLSSVDSLGKSDHRHLITYRTALIYGGALRPLAGERQLGVSATGLASNGLLGFGLPEERVIGASTYIILDFPRCGPSIPDEECRLKVMSDQVHEQK